MNVYSLLADVTVLAHLAYVLFIALGLAAIVAGGLRRWQWVRNPWFRLAHLLAIGLVALEAVCDIPCPLTVWERQLRVAAGQPAPQGTFIGRMVHQVLFFDLPSWVFTTAYVATFLVVLATLVLVPPRARRRQAQAGQGGGTRQCP